MYQDIVALVVYTPDDQTKSIGIQAKFLKQLCDESNTTDYPTKQLAKRLSKLLSQCTDTSRLKVEQVNATKC